MIVVIGLGNLGSAIGRRLAALGNDVVGVDPSPAAREAWESEGLPALTGLDDIAWTGVDNVWVVVRLADQMRDTMAVLHRELGTATGARRVFVVTTLDVESARQLADFCTPSLAVLESPISGGDQGALAGSLSVLVAGPDADAASDFLLATIAARVSVFDAYGQPATAKLLNNAAMALHAKLVADMLMLAHEAGLQPRKFFDFLVNSAGGSRAATKFQDLDASLLDKDVILLRSSLPAVASAGTFGRALADIADLESQLAEGRALLSGSAATATEGEGQKS
jgi:3-hydroxyisobutyrate dehydrogenase-like beta-hydroxyacid dehydrogenase